MICLLHTVSLCLDRPPTLDKLEGLIQPQAMAKQSLGKSAPGRMIVPLITVVISTLLR